MIWPLSYFKSQGDQKRIARDVRQNAEAAQAPLSGTIPTGLDVRLTKRNIGSFSAGRALLEGEVSLAGSTLRFKPGEFWDVRYPNRFAHAAAHSFGWLEDLSALGNAAARRMAQSLLAEWIERYGAGTGRCWLPGLAGRRVMMLTFEHEMILGGMSRQQSEAYFSCLLRHRGYLMQRARAAEEDREVFAALGGLVICHLALDRGHGGLAEAIARLADTAMSRIDPEGSIASRAPEDLLSVFADLVTVVLALEEAGISRDERLRGRIGAIGPGLRHLRMGDGTLPRFHGGGAGPVGLLERTLSDSGVRATISPDVWMGYARLSGGRVNLIIDCAMPPRRGAVASLAHASTLAFEMTSGRRPIVVNAGPGRGGSDGWSLRARETASHSTLGIEGQSSSLFSAGDKTRRLAEPVIVGGPQEVTLQRGGDASGAWLTATHDGYLDTHGLIHERRVFVATSGQEARGEDILRPPGRLGRARGKKGAPMPRIGAPAVLRFHLHPEVDVSPLASGAGLALRLRSGEVWTFECSGGDPTVEDSLYAAQGAAGEVASLQIVLRARIKDEPIQLLWRFAQETSGSRSIRDLVRDESQGGSGY